VRPLLLIVLGALLASAPGSVSTSATAAGQPGSAEVSASPEPRTLLVTLFADRTFREEQPAWRGLARRALAGATEDLAEAAGVGFAIETEIPGTVPRRNDGDLPGALALAAASLETWPGILLVVVGEGFHPPGTRPLLGFAYVGRPALIVVASTSARAGLTQNLEKHLTWIIRHELGHVLGVPHLPPPCMMAEAHEDRTWEFSPLALDVMRAMGSASLGAERPFEGADLTVMRDAYLFFAEQGWTKGLPLEGLAEELEAAGRAEDAKPLRAFVSSR
jgi:hypothetical protein